jgi:hypothetical protein
LVRLFKKYNFIIEEFGFTQEHPATMSNTAINWPFEFSSAVLLIQLLADVFSASQCALL